MTPFSLKLFYFKTPQNKFIFFLTYYKYIYFGTSFIHTLFISCNYTFFFLFRNPQIAIHPPTLDSAAALIAVSSASSSSSSSATSEHSKKGGQDLTLIDGALDIDFMTDTNKKTYRFENTVRIFLFFYLFQIIKLY